MKSDLRNFAIFALSLIARRNYPDPNFSMEHTFVMIKPDAVQRRLIGEIISRIEKKGLKISAMKMIKPDRFLLDLHYEEHVGKPWYDKMARYMGSSEVVALVVSGKNVVREMRKVIGSTDPQEALCGTIRGDLGMDKGRNLVHGSDSPKAAEREIGLWFRDGLDDEDKLFDSDLIYEKQD